MTRPCKTTRVGRQFDAKCDECPHYLIAHTYDRVCSICELVAEVRAELIGPPSRAKVR